MKVVWIYVAAVVTLAACGTTADDASTAAHEGTVLIDTSVPVSAAEPEAQTASPSGDVAIADTISTEKFREGVWLMPYWSATKLFGAPSFDSLSQADAIVGKLVAVKTVEPTGVDLADIYANAPYSVMIDTAAIQLVVEVDRASEGVGIDSGSQVVVPIDLGLFPQPDEGQALSIAPTEAIAAVAPIGIRLILVGAVGASGDGWTLVRETFMESAPGLFGVFFVQADGGVHSLDPRLQGDQFTDWLGADKTEAELLSAFRI